MFSEQEMQQRYEALPPELRNALDSTDMGAVVSDVCEKNGLLYDKMEALSQEIVYVILGLVKSADFVNRISKALEIDHEKAVKLAQDVNDEVFSGIRASLQKIQEGESHPADDHAAAQNDISSIEKAGGFSIERHSDTLENNSYIPEIRESDRAKILNGIENPTLHNTRPINVLENNALADHMLSGSVSKPMTTTEVKAPAPEKPKVDPYREPTA